MDLILTGRPVPADEAYAMGLVNRLVAPGEARAEAVRLAAEIARHPQTCLRNDRAALLASAGLPEPEALAVELAFGMESLTIDGVKGAGPLRRRRRPPRRSRPARPVTSSRAARPRWPGGSRVRVDHVPELADRHRRVHGHHQRGEHLAPGRADRGGADQHALVGVRDELDEARVAGLVDPAPGEEVRIGVADLDVDAALAGLLLGEADRPDLGIGEGDPGQRPVVGDGTLPGAARPARAHRAADRAGHARRAADHAGGSAGVRAAPCRRMWSSTSATTIAAWYMAMWVKAPSPVRSPTAQICSVTVHPVVDRQVALAGVHADVSSAQLLRGPAPVTTSSLSAGELGPSACR